MSRADLIYATLSSRPGELVTRRELFSRAGEFYLTNNAASEARVKFGVEIEHVVVEGEHAYRLALDSGEVERAESATAAASLVSSAPEHPQDDSPTGALEPHPDQLSFYELGPAHPAAP